jgi:hypothetical protein
MSQHTAKTFCIKHVLQVIFQAVAALGCGEKDVRRMLDPRHNSRINALQEALEALGKTIVLAVEDAA